MLGVYYGQNGVEIGIATPVTGCIESGPPGNQPDRIYQILSAYSDAGAD
jgi:hypothetical protein